ncbi:MAG: hypothetical protein KGJ55_12110 [Gammaproteobacteria bacterium]|nr:hypothetical protein [Gammaproteobacteria bacterium]
MHHPAAVDRRRTFGFTLIDLMVTLIVVAILTAVALPTYRSYVLRSHRAQARSILEDLAAREERYAMNHQDYATNFDFYLVNPASGSTAGAGLTAFYIDSEGRNSVTANGDSIYKIDFAPAPSATAFTLEAAAVGGQTDDHDCAVFTLQSNGLRGAQNAGGGGNTDSCWGR